MEVGLGPGDFVLDGDSAPTRKKAQPLLNFRPMSIGSNGWMDEDATWYGSRPHPSHIVLDGDPVRRVPPCERGTAVPPLFGPFIVAAVAHLSYC